MSFAAGGLFAMLGVVLILYVRGSDIKTYRSSSDERDYYEKIDKLKAAKEKGRNFQREKRLTEGLSNYKDLIKKYENGDFED